MNLRVHRDGRVLVSASRDTAQWEIEAFLLGNADFVLQNRERCLKLMKPEMESAPGKIDAMKMGMCSISVEKPAAFVLWRAERVGGADRPCDFSDTEKSIRCRQTQTDARRVSDTVLPGADGRNL